MLYIQGKKNQTIRLHRKSRHKEFTNNLNLTQMQYEKAIGNFACFIEKNIFASLILSRENKKINISQINY